MPKESKSVVYVRVTPEVRRRARVRAAQEGVHLGAVVEAALLQYLAKPCSNKGAS